MPNRKPDGKAERWTLTAVPPKVGQSPALSEAIETSWLPVIGPTAIALHRALVRRAVAGATEVVPSELADDVGLAGTGSMSPMLEALNRAQWNGLIRVVSDTHLEIPLTLDPAPVLSVERAKANRGAKRAGVQR